MTKKRVKIWFDDEGEPHESIVEEPDEPAAAAPPTAPARASASALSSPAAAGQRRTRIWFDEEGEPHEVPIDELPAPPRQASRPKQMWFDEEGEPHSTREAADAANARRQVERTQVHVERTQVSAPPQTHSSFTRGLTPKPMYFERVETQRGSAADAANPAGVPPAGPAPAGAWADATARNAVPGHPVAPRTTSSGSVGGFGAPPSSAGAPAAAPSARSTAPGSPPAPGARSTAASLGTPLGQRVVTPATTAGRAAAPQARATAPQAAQAAAPPTPRTAAPQTPRVSTPVAESSFAAPPAAGVGPREAPGRLVDPFGHAVGGREPDVTSAPQLPERVVQTPGPEAQPHARIERPAAIAPRPNQPSGVERTVVSPAPVAPPAAAQTTRDAPQPGASLAGNYRAAVARAAGNEAARSSTADRRPGAQAPLIGIDAPHGPASQPPFDDGYNALNERTVATATPFAAQFAATSAPVAGRISVAQPGPVVSRPTLTHTPVPMDDRAHQPQPARTGGFFNRAPQAPAATGGPGANPRTPPAEAKLREPSLENFFSRPEPIPAQAPQPMARRITDPIGVPHSPAPTPAPVARPAPAAAAPTAPVRTVHEQATVVRESPFLHSEPTVVHNPEAQEMELAPMRRRLTEPMLARGPGFIAPAIGGVETARAPLWRLAVATCIDGCVAAVVGISTAAAEMLMFGGHWPAEATNTLDALALWMHNYPGTERRAVLVALLFAWCYAALGARTGRTPGRMLMRLITIGKNGEMLSWKKAALRSCAALASALCFGAGYFWSIVDSRHRALHDIVSGSIVVTRKST